MRETYTISIILNIAYVKVLENNLLSLGRKPTYNKVTLLTINLKYY